ncbi:hypothetical protein V2S04_02155 [Microbacterium sp. OR21]|uniref:hypothetical protein n=1 Tax=Microbacterium sp. OR21 TaxID=3095346 RepID=UPI0039B5C67A
MTENTPNTPNTPNTENAESSSPEPAPAPAPSLPPEPAPAEPAHAAPAQTAPSFWHRTGTRVAAGVVAAVVLLFVAFGGGWLARGELQRPFGVTAPGQGWGHGERGMPGGGMPGMRDHDGDGFGGQRQDDVDGDDDDSTPGEQSTPVQPAPDSTTDSTPNS